jgi:hypothetical protein
VEHPQQNVNSFGKIFSRNFQKNSAFTVWPPETFWWKMTSSIPYMITNKHHFDSNQFQEKFAYV